MNDKYIGVFDSGMGGLTVVKSMKEALPDENIIYFGDTAHVPYGTRSKEQITEFVLNDVRFLGSFDIKAVVIACNTADCVARKKVEELYTLPVFGVIEAASKKAAAATANNKIGIIATNATVNSGEYEKNIKRFNPDAEVISAACSKLVPFAEEGRFRKGDTELEQVLRDYLVPFKEQGIDTLVLGCTHYPLFSDIIADILPEVTVISSSAAAVETLKASLCEKNLLRGENGGTKKYFTSGDAQQFERIAELILGESCGKVEHIEI